AARGSRLCRRRTPRARLARGRVLHREPAERGTRPKRRRRPQRRARSRGDDDADRQRGARRPLDRPSRRGLRRRLMSFGHPLLLLTLLLVPAALGALWLAERRRMRYAVRFTNLDALAGVARGGAWRRVAPAALFLAALAALCFAVARPHATTLVPQERATVILVIDVSRSMDARDVKPSRLLAAEAAV